MSTPESEPSPALDLSGGPALGASSSSPERLVWHYTKHDNLKLIINSHTMWAGDVNGLNDREELHLGIRRVKQAFKKLKREWDYHDSARTCC